MQFCHRSIIQTLSFVSVQLHKKKQYLAGKHAEAELIMQTYNFSLPHLQQARHHGKYLDSLRMKKETVKMYNGGLESCQTDSCKHNLKGPLGSKVSIMSVCVHAQHLHHEVQKHIWEE